MAIESLFWICLVGAAAPLVAGLIPRKLVPEAVLLLVFGMLIGPHALSFAHEDEAIGLLHELGLAMLFLLAGFEIEPKELAGAEGRRAAYTWAASLGIAFGVVGVLGFTDVLDAQIAVAIALTSTALGTLLPILKDRGLMAGPVGSRVLRHGAFGELGPVVAMALLLSARGTLASAAVLMAFAAVAAFFAWRSVRLRSRTSRVLEIVRAGAHTTGQTPVRITMLLLVTLIAVASVFELDIVLAAFAAGFILRLAVPDGNENLEARIEGISFGLLVPIFFVTSGMAVDPSAITENIVGFGAVIVLILLCRGVPVYLVTRLSPTGGEPAPSKGESAAIALFSSTGLPIIVAVTTVAVSAGEMSATNASVLVGAGAATVLIYPLVATLLLNRDNSAAPTQRTRSAD